MAYDISSFKEAFGFKTSTVSRALSSLKDRLPKLKKSAVKTRKKLTELIEAMELQEELLSKSAKVEMLEQKEDRNLSDIMKLSTLKKEVSRLKMDEKLILAGQTLESMQKMYLMEQAAAKLENPMAKGIEMRGHDKLLKACGLPKDFLLLDDNEVESSSSGVDLSRVLAGGGELDLDAPYVASDGKTYTVKKAIAGGGHSAFLIEDEEGHKFLFKPEPSEVTRQAEIGASKLSSVLMPDLVPPCTPLTVDGKSGSIQPFIEGADDNIDESNFTEKQQEQMVAHMLMDFLISNHDNHSKQFLFDGDGNLIGIDKGQAFKHFSHDGVKSSFVEKAERDMKSTLIPEERKRQISRQIEPDHLDPDYFPSGNFGSAITKDFVAMMQTRKTALDLSKGPVAALLKSAKTMTLESLGEMLGDYAKLAFPGKEKDFLKAVLARAKGLEDELSRVPLSAPDLAVSQLTSLDELLGEGDQYEKGKWKEISASIAPLTIAIKRLEKTEGVLAATAPEPEEQPSPEYKLKQQLEEMKTKLEKLKLIVQDGKDAENYLGGDYQFISPLLGAFEALKVDPSVYGASDYSYSSIKAKLLEKWKQIASDRSVTGTEGWDEIKMLRYFKMIQATMRSWDVFPVPEVPDGFVYRGDKSEHLLASYPALDPTKDLTDDVKNDKVWSHSVTIKWPGLMSTTYGDPKSHSYISGKSMVWKFTVKPPCAGRIIGDINPAEQEITFPIGATVQVKKVLVRKAEESKAIQAGEFGKTATYIIFADIS